MDHVGEVNLRWLQEKSYSREALEKLNQLMVTKPHIGKVCIRPSICLLICHHVLIPRGKNRSWCLANFKQHKWQEKHCAGSLASSLEQGSKLANLCLFRQEQLGQFPRLSPPPPPPPPHPELRGEPPQSPHRPLCSPIYQSVHQSNQAPTQPPIHPYLHPSIRLSICLSVHTVWPSTHLYPARLGWLLITISLVDLSILSIFQPASHRASTHSTTIMNDYNSS